MTCASCGREVPEGEFCGACGAHQRRGAFRAHAFAADPWEHVLHLSVVSTLLPHLPRRNAAPFRIGLLVLAAALALLGLTGLTGAAVVIASAAVPALYLVYLHEVNAYEDEPLRVLGGPILLGAVLGAAWATLTGPALTQAALFQQAQGLDPGRVLFFGVLLPVAAQLVMTAGALAAYPRRRFDEALDGFTFAAASALGFTFAMSVVNLLPELQQGASAHTQALPRVLELLERGLLVPILNAGLAGLLGGALWLRRSRVREGSRRVASSLVGAALLAIVARIALGLLTLAQPGGLVEVLGNAIAAAVVLLAARFAIHEMLLAEAVEVEVGVPMPCSHCGRLVPRMAFCPQCGVAVRATPKTGRGREARATR